MTTMLDRLARILRTERLKATDASPIMVAFSQDAPPEDADTTAIRAVLAELRDPPDAVLQAGASLVDLTDSMGLVLWQTMLDEITADTEKPPQR